MVRTRTPGPQCISNNNPDTGRISGLNGEGSGRQLMNTPGSLDVSGNVAILGMPLATQGLSYISFGIVIDGDEGYKDRVRGTLNWMARSDTGLLLLNAIKRTGKEIVIAPWKGNSCNATAEPHDYRDATAAGYGVLMGGASFEYAKEPSLIRDLLGLPKEMIEGTGEGSDVTAWFSPSMFAVGTTGVCSTVGGLPGASPSQVLFHELAHAYRQANGTYHPRPTVGGSTRYTNMEEFFAVVLTNVLISDPTYSSGNRTLRADHAGFNSLAPALSTSQGFVAHIPNRNKLRELVASEPELTRALQSVGSSFNPFTEPL